MQDTTPTTTTRDTLPLATPEQRASLRALELAEKHCEQCLAEAIRTGALSPLGKTAVRVAQ